MRLWYQSMTRAQLFGSYLDALRVLLDGLKRPGTTIDVHGITRAGGLGRQQSYLDFLEMAEVLDNVGRAAAEGYDAFLIGHFTDSALHEAREITRMPVLGLCESTLHIACMMGASFSLVTLSEKSRAHVLSNVRRCGLELHLADAPTLALDRPIDLDRAFAEPAEAERVCDQFLATARASTARGAEVVIAAGGVLMALLARAGIHEVKPGVPLLNGITALLKAGEMVVDMNRIMGGAFVSKRLTYAPPPGAQIAEIRRYYGTNVYPEESP
jgi:allantoin racemase